MTSALLFFSKFTTPSSLPTELSTHRLTASEFPLISRPRSLFSSPPGKVFSCGRTLLAWRAARTDRNRSVAVGRLASWVASKVEVKLASRVPMSSSIN
ncbi:hypothetical protein TYRP_017467 [Tyrophagus putrescentiae]|nr:hypothetical protein TYRP_017467 [Tyrophagus putrescentiae]